MSKDALSQYGGLPQSTESTSSLNNSRKDSFPPNYANLPIESPPNSPTINISTNNNLPSPTQSKRSNVKSAPVSQYGGLPEALSPNSPPIHITQYGGLTEHVLPYGGMPNEEASQEVMHQYGGLPDPNKSSSSGSQGIRDSKSSTQPMNQHYGGLPGADPMAQYRGLPPASPSSQYGGLPASSKPPMSPTISSRQQQEFRQKLQQQQVDLIATQSSKNHNAYITTPEMEELMKQYQPQ